MVVCPRLYFASISSLYFDLTQFAVIKEYPTLQIAHTEALDHLRSLVVKYGLAQFWRPGKKKTTPVSLCLPKN